MNVKQKTENLFSDTTTIKYGEYKKRNLFAYYADQYEKEGSFLNAIYLVITIIIAYKALFAYYSLIGVNQIVTLKSILATIAVFIFVISADGASTDFGAFHESISVYVPNLWWISLFTFALGSTRDPVVVTAWIIGMYVTFMYYVINRAIAPLFPFVRFEVKFLFNKFEMFLFVLLSNAVFVTIIGLCAYYGLSR